MTRTHRDIASFVLRFTQDLWQDAQGEPRVQWRGHIRHVQGDDESRFTDFAEAVGFIQRHLMEMTLEAVQGEAALDQSKAVRESFKLWETFANSYAEMMSATMERTMQQSEAFRKQMDDAVQKTLQAWQAPTAANPSEIVEALNDLRAQVRTLSEKVDRLEQAARTESK